MYCEGKAKGSRFGEAFFQSIAVGREFALSWVLSLTAALATGNTFAVTLDAIVEQSMLGQPLRLVVALGGAPNEIITGECVRIVRSEARTNDAATELGIARVDLEHIAGRGRLVVTTRQPINDLAMRVALRVGCETPITREYVILLDPPLPDVERSAEATNAVQPTSALIERPIALAAALDITRVASEAATSPAPLGESVTRNNERASGGPPPARRRSNAGGVLHPSSSGARRPSAPDEGGRLKVSRTVEPRTGSTLSSTFDALPESEKLAIVLEQEAVLRQRVADLSAQVQRMQQERIAELTAAIEKLQQDLRAAEAKELAEAAATRVSTGGVTRWFEGVLPILVWLLIIAALVAGILAWRSRRLRRDGMPIGETPTMASAPDMMGPSAEDDNSLFVGHYMGSPRVKHPERGTTKSRAEETASPSKAPDAEFDYDILAQSAPIKYEPDDRGWARRLREAREAIDADRQASVSP